MTRAGSVGRRATGLRRGLATCAAGLAVSASLAALPVDAADVSPVPGAGSLPPLPGVPVTTAQSPGPQPQVAARPCSFAPLRHGELRVVFQHLIPLGDLEAEGFPVDTVDPFQPCHVFGALQDAVTRSDGDAQPVVVFHAPPVTVVPALPAVPNPTPVPLNPAAGATPVTVRASLGPVVAVRDGQEYFADQAAGYGVMASPDAGEHWQQRSAGLPVTADVTSIRTLAFAPSNPLVGYAVLMEQQDIWSGPAATALFGTADGGQTWRPLPTDAEEVVAVGVDPRDAQHVYLAESATGGAMQESLRESRDGGLTWSTLAAPPQLLGSGESPVALLVTHPSGAGVRLYVETSDGNGLVMYWQSRDDGASWQELPVGELQPPGIDTSPQETYIDRVTVAQAPTLVADPDDADAMVFARNTVGGGPVELLSSTDGFATIRSTTFYDPPGDPRSPGRSLEANLRLTADARHDFFLEASVGTYGVWGGYDDLVAFDLAALTRSLPVVHPKPLPPPAALPGLDTTSAVRHCALELPLFPDATAPATITGGQGSAGSLTFDGEYLDYTHDSQAPDVVYRLDPVTCRPAAALVLAVPRDATGDPQPLRSLTFDARYVFPSGDRGAILALGRGDARTQADGTIPVYAIDPLTGVLELAFYLPPGAYWQYDTSVTVFTYDYFTDSLWIQAPDITRVKVPAIRGAVAQPVDGCMNGNDGNTGVFSPSLATLVMGADGIVYGQMEDDTSVRRVDVRTCTVVGGFRHAPYSEPANEDEQMACDPVTFGVGLASPGGGAGRSVIWIRDSMSNGVDAYVIPDGFCPFPTRLALTAPRVAPVGAVVGLCAQLRRESATHPAVAAADVDFRIDGQRVASALTDAAGLACVHAVAPGPPGMHAVRADFAGTPVLLPSHDEHPLRTFVVVAAAGVPPPGALPLPPPVASTQPLPANQPQPEVQNAVQAEGQAQVEVQAQAQVSVQSSVQAQVGVLPQRQVRSQVAMQPSRMRTGVPVYNASRLMPERRTGSPVVPAIAVALLLGLASCARRPRAALARARPRRL